MTDAASLLVHQGRAVAVSAKRVNPSEFQPRHAERACYLKGAVYIHPTLAEGLWTLMEAVSAV
jgi:hypothetical protein